MRFKKGTKVEVLSRKEVPSGAWHNAEIICGDGHYFSVRYLPCFHNDAVVERVPRKAIRPCPPLLSRKNWVSGDVVEVYDNFSWKIAIISTVLRERHCFVRLLGSNQEIKVQICDIRSRQCWKDEKWFLIKQGSRNDKEYRSDKNMVLKYNQKSNTQLRDAGMKFQAKDDFLPCNNVPESQVISSKTLKRGSPYGCSHLATHVRSGQKFRIVEKDGQRIKEAAAVNLSSFPKQRDGVSFPQEMLVQNCTHAANRRSGFSAMDIERRATLGDVGCSVATNLNYKDDVSAISSVGSCSTTCNNSYKLSRHLIVPTQDEDDQISDAESVCPLEHNDGGNFSPVTEKQHFLVKEDVLKAEVHKLELHAYCRTLEAFHASGPLSWERETLVTNLRLALNISNDEHLMVLRNLIS